MPHCVHFTKEQPLEAAGLHPDNGLFCICLLLALCHAHLYSLLYDLSPLRLAGALSSLYPQGSSLEELCSLIRGYAVLSFS